MSVEFTCGDPAGLAGYLYDECEPGERAEIEVHLAGCARCATDVASLRATRSALASWAPPDAQLGFRITSAADQGPVAATVLRPARWWRRPLPAWAQMAAALVIFLSGAWIGTRAGAPPAAPQVPAARAAETPAPARAAVSAQDLAALEGRLRAEMTSLRTSAARPQPAPASAGEGAVMQQVRTLLAESEERHRRELAFRLNQVLRDVDTQRRVDLMRIEQTFGQMEGFTRPELEDQRQKINYLIQRTGMQRPPQE
jgi:anti-sigma factor RsiW